MGKNPERMDPSKHLGFIIRQLHHITSHQFENSAKRKDLDEVTMNHGRILGYLYHHRDQTVYQKDLEDAFCINRSSVATVMKLMEKKGYIERISDSTDARLKRIVLTPLGEQIHFISLNSILETEEKISNTLTKEECETFLQLANKMMDGLRELEKEKNE